MWVWMKKYATSGGSVELVARSTNRQQASSCKTTWFSHKQKENDFRTSIRFTLCILFFIITHVK